jgi:uncharacterized RmlC-like cupin family protein
MTIRICSNIAAKIAKVGHPSEPEQIVRVCTGKVRVWHGFNTCLKKHCVVEKHDSFNYPKCSG